MLCCCLGSATGVHDAVTYFTICTYKFCWPVRTLRQRDPDGQWVPRTPAMAAGLTDHVWPADLPGNATRIGHKEGSCELPILFLGDPE